jgi:multidrug resistance efflux pump
LSLVLPKLRKDLEITHISLDGGYRCFFLKDPKSGEIIEFGEEEYFLCRQLDGQTDLPSIRARFEESFGVSIELDELEAFMNQLDTLGLLVSETWASDVSTYYPSDQIQKLRLGDPDRLLTILAASLGWCFSPAFLMGLGLILALALGIVLKFGSDFIYELKTVWRPSFFFLLPIFGIFVINVLCEVAKGVACKHYGGYVHEFGVWFRYKIIPHFYCDIGDALWMNKKIDRIQIMSAGIVCQLLLWGIGIIGWKNTASWTDVHIFWLIFTAASSLYLFLSLNPLIQRDAYYVLSTWLEIPDLRNRAIALTRSWILRRPLPEPLTSREILGFRWYGLLSKGLEVMFWILVLGLSAYFLTHFLKGIGALLYLIFLCFRFENTLKRQFMRILPARLRPGNELGAIPLRWLIRGGLLTVIILILLVPYPFTVGGEIRLLPVHQLGIRVQVPSNIESILVEEGQWVKKGQPVAVLLGRDQKKRKESAKAALDEARARLCLLREGPKPEEIAKAEQEVKTSAKSLEYSMLQAGRYEEMFRHKAVPEKDYERVLKVRDVDLEQLKLTERNLELVKSGPRDEEIKALEAEVRRMEVELAHAEEDLRLITLTSPADGRIITPYLSQKVGQFLGVGDLFAVAEDARTIIAEIEVPEEDVGEVRIGARVKLKTWVYPGTTFIGHVTAIAPVAYEKSRHRVERALSENEWRIEQKEILREKGKVVRLLSELPNPDGLLKTDMTGYAKIECGWKPLGIAFTRWAVRFFMIEVWSWIP